MLDTKLLNKEVVKGIQESTNQALQRITRQASQQIYHWGRANTPVDTGKLKSSWRMAKVQGGYKITNDCPYYNHVDLGTQHQRPQMITQKILARFDKFYGNK